ncbi:hypothetical protein Tco_0261166 [Tanacetum coccineum]
MVRRADKKEYKFREIDFSRLDLNDIEDMFLLYVQGKMYNFEGHEIVDLVNALHMFTRISGLSYKEPYTPFFDPRGVVFLGKLNITRPQTTISRLSYKEPYTPFFDMKGVVFLTKNNRKKLMRANELFKFCDGTLKSVREVLHYRLTNFKLGYNANMPTRAWTNKDQNRIAAILKEIDDLVLERRIMRSLECFVGGRNIETDPRLLTRTK